MAKKVQGYIKLQIPAGGANPSPPVGPALGQQGVNIMEFCKQFNARTQKLEPGMPIPVVITVFQDRSFTFVTKSPPNSYFIMKAAGIEKGAKTVGTQVVGKVRLANEPLTNHWWNVPLYVTARGLTTSLMPHPTGPSFQIAFDFLDHRLDITTVTGQVRTLALTPRPVAEFYTSVMAMLEDLAVATEIWPCCQFWKRHSMKNKTAKAKKAQLAALKKESERALVDQIRRLLDLPMNKRTHFLRVRHPNGGSHL